MSNTKATYFLFDTETGGFDPHKNSLLSLYGMVLNSNLDVLDEIDLLIKPNDGDCYKVQAAAMAVNKIDLVQHEKAANFLVLLAQREIKSKFLQWTNSAQFKLIPSGHGVRFDLNFLESFLEPGEMNLYIGHRPLDTSVVGQYLQLVGALPSTLRGNLGDLCAHAGIDTTGEHNAKVDATNTLLLLRYLKAIGEDCFRSMTAKA